MSTGRDIPVDTPLTPLAFGAAAVPATLDRPTLFFIVDTEEEFDWSAPLRRDQTGVKAMRHIERLQTILSGYRVKPTYVLDYPVATQRDGYGPLLDILRSGEADVGAHLHPWVNPPLTEELSARNSYGCRLGALEAEKIRVLRDAIRESFGVSPVAFKAGRYGFGTSTAAALEDLGFDIDLSINPRMDYSHEGGPDFGQFNAQPFFFGRSRRLLEIPCSTDYVGMAGRSGRPMHRIADRPAFRRLRAVGILSRLGIVNKVMLSPEGSTIAELKALTRTLVARGIRTLSMTMHSPSVMPGCTPYVRTDEQLRRFLDSIREYCDFFLGELGGVAGTPAQFYRMVRPPGSLTGADR